MREVYTWVGHGGRDADAPSWRDWEALGDDASFIERFEMVLQGADSDAAAPVPRVEQFLLAEAVALGVVVKRTVSPSVNPNRVDKHLAPWFTEDCRSARKEYKAMARRHGRQSVAA